MMKQIKSFALPLVVVIVVPFFLIFDFRQQSLRVYNPLPILQSVTGGLLCLAGLVLLATTISLFIRQGRGTLAPWDPTSRLVVRGPYAYTRNPMISGVAFLVLGESVLFGSVVVFVWFAIIVVVNTLYFKLSEEPGLVKRFGSEYEEYRRHVPMWLPRFTPWRDAAGSKQ